MGVAATKTFFAQLLSFYGLAIKFAEIKGSRSLNEINNLITELIKLPPMIEDLLEQHHKSSEKLAHEFFNHQPTKRPFRIINFINTSL